MKEDYLQYKLCDWMRGKEVMHFHVPNGGKREPREAARFVAMGVKKGVHDLIVLLDGGIVLFVELKTGKNKLQPEQIKFDEWLKKAGHQSHLIHADSVDCGIQQLQSILHCYGWK